MLTPAQLETGLTVIMLRAQAEAARAEADARLAIEVLRKFHDDEERRHWATVATLHGKNQSHALATKAVNASMNASKLAARCATRSATSTIVLTATPNHATHQAKR